MFDYIFTGCGVSALLLLNEIIDSPLKHKKILLIDRDKKDINDRTICYWTKTDLIYNQIATKTFSSIDFQSINLEKSLILTKQKYYMLRSIDFYKFVKDKASNFPNIEFKTEVVEKIETIQNVGIVKTNNGIHKGKFIFNSIYETKQYNHKDIIFQCFKGWVIETDKEVFIENKAKLFDFRVEQENDMRFFYTIPITKNIALIEYVGLRKNQYDNYLKMYIEKTLGIKDYKILETEGGINPLTTQNIKRKDGIVLNIGIAGGLLKPSSGYGFTRMINDSKSIVDSLLKFENPFKIKKSKLRFKFIDFLFLKFLKHNPSKAQYIFEKLFQNNSGDNIFDFLDENMKIWDIFKLGLSLPKWLFMRNIFH